jgi:hypothetical protein
MIPSGHYSGHVVKRFTFLNHFWKGKIFTDATVTNKLIGGLRLFRGRVSVINGTDEIRIYYPLLRITDTLKPIGISGHVFRGRTTIFGITIRFLLIYQGDN